MTLDVLESRYRIKLADDDFFNLLLSNSEKLGEYKVVCQLFDGIIQIYYENTTVYSLKNSNLWFSHFQKNNRSLFAFGIETPEANDPNLPVCLIDFPTEGIDNNCIGAYGDDGGNVSILIRVNYQKLRKIPSNNILTSPERVQATEKGKKRYFITLGQLNQTEILPNLMKFVQEMGGITDNDGDIHLDLEDPEDLKFSEDDNDLVEDDKVKCVACGEPLANSNLNLEDEVNSFKQKDNDKCYDCMGKIQAARGISEIKKHVSIKLFNKKTLLKASDDPETLQNYFNILKKLNLIKDFSKDVYIFNQAQNIDQYLKTYSEYLKVPLDNSKEVAEDIQDTNPTPSTLGEKVCEVCGAKLDLDNFYKSKDSPDGLTGKCKDCSRKSHAAKAIDEIRKYVEPATSFNKEDLLKESNNRMVFLDYFWTLQEFDLLEEDKQPDFYLLKREEELNEFIAKYGDESQGITEPIIEKPAEKKSAPKLAKPCQICQQTLPISNFYKSPSNEDGYSDKCKECSRKSYAARALGALLECVEPGVSFYKKDLLDQCENQLQFRDYFWTLQELDLLEYNEKTDLYSLKEESVLNEFLHKYGEKPLEEEVPLEDVKDDESVEVKPESLVKDTDIFELENTDKDVKVCFTCGKSLPISNFYKSSYNADGLVDNCKNCADTKNAAKIVMEIQEHVEIGIPFTKNDLSKKIENETRANYYIWTLQEQDLISYNERTDTYILEDNDKFKVYQDIIKAETSEDTNSDENILSEDVKIQSTCKIKTEKELVKEDSEELPASYNVPRKEIIYISDNNGSPSNIILKGIIKNDNLIQTFNDLEALLNSNTNKILVNQYIENYLEVLIDLNVKNESIDEAINLLQEENWVDKTNNRN